MISPRDNPNHEKSDHAIKNNVLSPKRPTHWAANQLIHKNEHH